MEAVIHKTKCDDLQHISRSNKIMNATT